MSTLERAIEIAAAAHAGQVDKAGQPYILHPIRVMLRVTGSHARMAAILHDVVEDTPVTIDQLVGEGFPAEVVAAVIALTKLPGETRLAAAARATGSTAAPTARDHARLAEYEQVRALLLAHADGAAPPGA